MTLPMDERTYVAVERIPTFSTVGMTQFDTIHNKIMILLVNKHDGFPSHTDHPAGSQPAFQATLITLLGPNQCTFTVLLE